MCIRDRSYTKVSKEFGSGTISLTTENCYIQGSTFSGATNGNLYSDVIGPLAFGPDFSVDPCSPTVDAGNDVYLVSTEDLAGNPRVYNALDIGAYESQYDCGNTRIFASIEEDDMTEEEKVIAMTLSVSPNPTVDMIKVNTNAENAIVHVFSSTGVLLETTNQIEIDLSSYPTGLYMIVAEQDGQLIGTEKVMKR